MKKIIAVLLSLFILLSASICAYANETEKKNEEVLVTEFAHINDAATTFSISSDGLAIARSRYSGKSNNFKKATITTKIQKKVGVVWVTVSGGKWTDTSSSVNFAKSHKLQLSSKGTYRAHVKYVISGSSGEDDEITKNVQKTYS